MQVRWTHTVSGSDVDTPRRDTALAPFSREPSVAVASFSREKDIQCMCYTSLLNFAISAHRAVTARTHHTHRCGDFWAVSSF